MTKGFFLIALFLFQTIAFSQNDTLKIKEVIIKGKRLSKPELSGTLSSIEIDQGFIQTSQGNTLMNSLEQLPGISAIHNGVGISKPVIRGMSFNRVIVSEYGIKQEGQQWGIDHGLELDQYKIDNIEILKGPVSMLYGSDGLAGVINIVWPKIPEHDTLMGTIYKHYKSGNDNGGISARLEGKKNKTWWRLQSTLQHFADYKVPANEFNYNRYLLPIYDRRLKNTAGREYDGSLILGFTSRKQKLLISISQFYQHQGFFVGAFGVPRSYQLQSDGDNRNVDLPSQTISHSKLNTTYDRKGKKLIWTVDLGYQLNQRQEFSNPHAHDNFINSNNTLALNLSLHTLSYRINSTLLSGNFLRFSFGSNGQYQRNSSSGFEFLIPAFQSSQAGMYAITSINFHPRMFLIAGLRLDYARQFSRKVYVSRNPDSIDQHNIEVIKRSPDIENVFLVPTFSAGSKLEASEWLTIKYNVGSAFRIPALAELTSNGVHHGTFRHELGDSSLTPEKGILQDLQLEFPLKKLKFQLMLFYYRFNNYIYLRPSAKFSPLPDAGQIYQYQQAASRMKGIEHQIEFKFSKKTKFTNSSEYVWNINFDTGYPLPFTPPLTVFSSLEFSPVIKSNRKRHTILTFQHQYSAQQIRTDRNEPTTDGYHLFNMFCEVSLLRKSKKKLTTRAMIRNIFNTHYLNNMSRYRILNLPEQGRNIIVSMVWSL
jgi:iron complex outermembrane receptor protein